LKQNKSQKDLAQYFNVTVRDIEDLCFYFHAIKLKKNSKLANILNNLDAEAFISDRQVLTSAELIVKYDLKTHY